MKRSLLHDLSADECWPWRGHCDPHGYGRAYPEGARANAKGAHRVVWALLNGPINDDLHVDHACHDPAECKLISTCPHRRCVNPHHLRVTTAAENVLRSNSPVAANARKTHCKNGHPFDEYNNLPHGNGYGRKCRICEAIRARAKRAAAGAKPRPARRRIEIPR